MKLVIHRYEAILAGSLLLLSGAVIPSSWEPPVQTLRRPVVAAPATRRFRIALTFDDGPHPVMTERLLKVLQDEHVPATFFVVGKMADRYPQIVQEMAQQGNEIANHTYTHPCLPTLSNAAILTELAETRETIRRLTGQDSLLYRPPGGDYSTRMVRTTARAGYHMILWSVLTKDVQGATERAIYQRIVDGAADGGIVLMHSGIATTVDVLPRAIEALRAQGYEFVTVSQLLGRRGTPSSAPIVFPDAVHSFEDAADLPAPNRPHLE